MNQKIAIRCIADPLKGYGNFNRSVVLAESLRKKDCKIIFIINQNNSIIRELQNRKFHFILIPKLFTYETEPSFLIDFMNLFKCKVIIVDMREYGEKISKSLMNKNFKIILLDDAWCKKAYADFIFNGTIIKQYHQYEKINKNAKLYLGSKYFLNDIKFQQYKKKISGIHDKKMYNVVVSIGGSDPDELSLFVVKSIMNISNIQIIVVVGPFFKNLIKLRNFVKNKNNMTVVYFPKQIWKIFQKSDIAISNAGSTLYELAIQKVPTICIAAVKHQIPYAKGFESKGFAVNLGFWKNLKSDIIEKTLMRILDEPTERKKMWLSGSKIIYGDGLSRTTNLILRILKTTSNN